MILNDLVLWDQAFHSVSLTVDNPITLKRRLIDGLSNDEKGAMCEALLFIHLTRNVFFGRGVLESDCGDRTNAVHLLNSFGFVDKYEMKIRDVGKKIIFIDNQFGYDIATKLL
jgi:hypothetical protein